MENKRYCILTCGLILIHETLMLIYKNCSSCKAVLYTLLVFELLIDGLKHNCVDWRFRGGRVCLSH